MPERCAISRLDIFAKFPYRSSVGQRTPLQKGESLDRYEFRVGVSMGGISLREKLCRNHPVDGLFFLVAVFFFLSSIVKWSTINVRSDSGSINNTNIYP